MRDVMLVLSIVAGLALLEAATVGRFIAHEMGAVCAGFAPIAFTAVH